MLVRSDISTSRPGSRPPKTLSRSLDRFTLELPSTATRIRVGIPASRTGRAHMSVVWWGCPFARTRPPLGRPTGEAAMSNMNRARTACPSFCQVPVLARRLALGWCPTRPCGLRRVLFLWWPPARSSERAVLLNSSRPRPLRCENHRPRCPCPLRESALVEARPAVLHRLG